MSKMLRLAEINTTFSHNIIKHHYSHPMLKINDIYFPTYFRNDIGDYTVIISPFGEVKEHKCDFALIFAQHSLGYFNDCGQENPRSRHDIKLNKHPESFYHKCGYIYTVDKENIYILTIERLDTTKKHYKIIVRHYFTKNGCLELADETCVKNDDNDQTYSEVYYMLTVVDNSVKLIITSYHHANNTKSTIIVDIASKKIEQKQMLIHHNIKFNNNYLCEFNDYFSLFSLDTLDINENIVIRKQFDDKGQALYRPSFFDSIVSYGDKIYVLTDSDVPLENQCTVCFGYTDKKEALIPCGHTKYCKKCINKAVQSSNCFICNGKVSTSIELK